MVKTKPTILLNEAFRDAFEGYGIFSEMTDMPWSNSQIVDSSLLDFEYFGNHSGDKKCSPLVYKLLDNEYMLGTDARQKLAALVKAKYLPNWQALWNTYHLEYDPIADYVMREEGEAEESSSGTRSATKNGSNTGTDNLSLQHGESISKSGSNTGTDNTSTVHGEEISKSKTNTGTDTLEIEHGESITKNGTNTGTDNLSIVHGEQITINDTATGTKDDSKYGFNSSVAVPTDSSSSSTTDQRTETHSGTDQNNRTLDLATSDAEAHTGTDTHERTLNLSDSETEEHSGTDQNNRTLNLSNSESETHSGTDAHNRTLNLAHADSESGTESGTKDSSYNKTRKGLTGAHSIQELIQRERELWIEDYFERVFADVDTVLASMVYVRENRFNRYPHFPFGYYNF